MKGWPVKQLGEVCEFVRGITFKPTDLVETGSLDAVACFRTKNVQLLLEDEDVFHIPRSFVKTDRQLVREGDTLISTANSNNLVGKCCLVPHLNYPATLGGFIAAIRSNPDKIQPRFLYHWLASPTTQMRLRCLSRQTTNISNLPLTDMAKMLISVPPLPEQGGIVKLLDEADELRKLRAKAAHRTAILIPALFHKMFGDPETKPQCWPVKLLPEIAFFQEGPGVRKWQFRSSGIKLINVGNISNGQLDLSSTDRHLDKDEAEKTYSHFLLNTGDLVMATSGVTWGKVAFVESHHLPLCLNTSVVRFRPLNADICSPMFLRAFFETPAFRRQVDRLITGSAQPNFGPSHLKQIRLPVPPIRFQTEFAQKVAEIRELEAAQSSSRQRLDDLFQSMLHRAFNGEL